MFRLLPLQRNIATEQNAHDLDSQEYEEYIENDAQVKNALGKLYSMYSKL